MVNEKRYLPGELLHLLKMQFTTLLLIKNLLSNDDVLCEGGWGEMGGFHSKFQDLEPVFPLRFSKSDRKRL